MEICGQSLLEKICKNLLNEEKTFPDERIWFLQVFGSQQYFNSRSRSLWYS